MSSVLSHNASSLTLPLSTNTGLYLARSSDGCRSLHGQQKPPFTAASPNTLNPGVLDQSGDLAPTPHAIYVDDGIYLDIADRQRFEQVTAAGIKAVSILLGDSNIIL